jgi:dual specificity protein kinase YAK1
MMEVTILNLVCLELWMSTWILLFTFAFLIVQLNTKFDPDNSHNIARLLDTFIYRKHLCLVFELLSLNLYELIKQNQFRGLSTNLVRVFTAQILEALVVLSEAKIVHCDLKPENILLKRYRSPSIITNSDLFLVWTLPS